MLKRWDQLTETVFGAEGKAPAWKAGARDLEHLLEDARAFLEVTATGPLSQPICFVHVPKCAGTSVDAALRRVYRSVWELDGDTIHKLDPRACDRVARGTETSNWRVRETVLAYYLSQSDTQYASGHFQITGDFLDRFGDEYAFVSLLRHPVDRWISHYLFNTYKDPGHEYYIGADMEEFLETERARGIGQIFLAYFSGTGELGPEERANSDALARAKKNLERFDLVGFVERMETFERRFAEQFGVEINAMRRNESPASDEEKTVEPEVRAKIREVCREDIELYNQALEKFGE